jgi:DNA polymerase-3 subunit alpha
MSSADALNRYNLSLYLDLWEKWANGNEAHWSMNALTYYDKKHELEDVNEELYGIVNFNELPEEPVPYEFYTRYINGELKHIPKYVISRIAGTVINADNGHFMVSLLTKYGLVNVKMSKGHYAFYNKSISQMGEDGKSHRVEESWLKRGQMIIVSGIRIGDTFYPRIYNDTIYKHTVALIKEVNKDGTLLLQYERTKDE